MPYPLGSTGDQSRSRRVLPCTRLLLDFGMRLTLSRPIDHSRNSYVPRNGAGLIFYMCPLLAWYSTSTRSLRCSQYLTTASAVYVLPKPTLSARMQPWLRRPRRIRRGPRLGNPRRNTPRRDRHCPVHRCRPCNLCWSRSRWSKRSHHQPERGHGIRWPYTQRRSEIRKTVAQELFDQIGLVVKEINGGGIECPAGSPSRGVL